MKSLFYKPIKIKHPDNDILFWGCLHANHECRTWSEPLWKQRGYSSMQDHDDSNLRNWNSKATDNTIGVWLGDNRFGSGGAEAFLNLVDKFKFKWLYCMSGNHTAGWWQAFESADQNILQIGEKTIIFVPNYVEFIINNQSVVASHYPVLSWNGQGGGSFMLFSHVHANLDKSAVGRAYVESGARCLETNVDKFKSPPNFKEVKDILFKREKVSFDHHNAEVNNPF